MSTTTEVEIYLGEGVYVYDEVEVVEEKPKKKKLIITPKKKLIIKKKIEEEVEEVEEEEHGDIIGMMTIEELDFETLEEARTEFNDYVVENVGELLYLDEMFEDGDQDNLECRGELGQDY